MQVLVYMLMAATVLGLFTFSIALITALKRADMDSASILISRAIFGLGCTIVILVIILILKYYFKI